MHELGHNLNLRHGGNNGINDTLVIVVADLEVVSFAAVNPPAEIIIGQAVDI
jgi:hypothetical protein